jgi:anti-sigma factor RsiW
MREVNDPKCGRETDLIGFLYGELDQVEALSFQRHLNDCATCATELSGLGAVRESVVAWRNESLAGIGLANQVTDVASSRSAPARPSALAAWREFFNLSPLWLKGAVACATVLFFVFAGLAVARLQKSEATAVVNPAPAQTTQEFNATVERRVQEELQRIKDSNKQEAKNAVTAKDSTSNPVERIVRRRNLETASNNARRPLSKSEREQLAADLRLVSGRNDTELNLLDDTINQ